VSPIGTLCAAPILCYPNATAARRSGEGAGSQHRGELG
jgi:hypothetical protein